MQENKKENNKLYSTINSNVNIYISNNLLSTNNEGYINKRRTTSV